MTEGAAVVQPPPPEAPVGAELVQRAATPGGALDNKRLQGGLASGNGVISPERWQMLAAIAETVYKTAFVPTGLRGNAPATLACLLYGDAQGLHPMIALKEVHVIDGTPSMSAAVMVGKVRDAGKGHRLKRKEIRNEAGGFVGCTAIGERGDDGETDEFTFTIEMAGRAGLLTKANWKHYPEAMCWHRAASQLCTFLFPDVFMGSPYVPEELGAAETDADGRLDGQEPTAASENGGAEEQPPAGIAELVDEQREADAAVVAELEAKVAEHEAHEELKAKVAAGDDLSDEELHEATEQGLIRDGQAVIANEGEDNVVVAGEVVVGPGETKVVERPAPDDDQREAATSAAELEAAVASEAERAEQQLALAIPKADGNGVVPYGKQTIPMILGFAASAPAEWLEGYLAHERAHKDRARLINELEGFLAQRRAAAPADAASSGASEEGGPAENPPSEVGPPAQTGEMVVAGETLGPEQTSSFLAEPAPEDEVSPERRVLLTKLRAAIAWMGDKYPEAREWRLEAVIASASRIWNVAVHSLDDLTDVQLEQIWTAIPEDAREALALVDGPALEKLATQA